MAGSYAGGPISGACLNPALSIAFVAADGTALDLLIYTLGPLVGAVIAVLLIMGLEPEVARRRFIISKQAIVRDTSTPRSLPPESHQFGRDFAAPLGSARAEGSHSQSVLHAELSTNGVTTVRRPHSALEPEYQNISQV